MSRTVKKIQFAPQMPKALRVAAYARVSSGKDAMLHSLAAQVDYYSTYIRHHPGWEYVGVYADEAKTGTKDSRENFQRMLADCRAGRIDHIITKSISRFSRNTVTLLETVRELKELGISVYFEEQSIDTATADGELMFSVLASYAQEESLSASENQKWRVKRNFEAGIPWRFFLLGYRREGDKLVAVPEEAEKHFCRLPRREGRHRHHQAAERKRLCYTKRLHIPQECRGAHSSQLYLHRESSPPDKIPGKPPDEGYPKKLRGTAPLPCSGHP